MIFSKGTTEFDHMKLKGDSLDISINDKKSKNFGLLILIILILFLLFFSILIINKKSNYLKYQLQKKDLEIEKLKRQIIDLSETRNSSQQENQYKNRAIEEALSPLDRKFLYDKNFYKNNNMVTNISLNKLGYKSIMHTHSIEKGMQHFELRPFASKITDYIMSLIIRESKYHNFENKFVSINWINLFEEYKRVYEEHNWTNKEEYIKVNNFLKNYTKVENQKAGAYILTKKELQNDYEINYLKFVRSRHSTRNYKNEAIKLEDVKKAVEMAKYTASACNRQYIKLHFYPSGKMRDNVIKYAVGKGGLYLNDVNTFIITFDVNGLKGAGERNQGYFNAGLYSTNLVNAFHSLGIGTCFIQFSNSVNEEDQLKKMNEIPEYERIAVILFAGYYDEKSIFAVSPRKNMNELLIEHK